MVESSGLLEEIQQKREKLLALFNSSMVGFLDSDLYQTSCEMDALIVEYTKNFYVISEQ